MANRFGTDYDIDRYYFDLQERNVAMRRSHIHDQIRQEARNKKALATQQAEAKSEREKKQEYVASGSGHCNIGTFLSPQVTNRSKQSFSVPVTNDMNNKKRSCNVLNPVTIQSLDDNPTYKQSEDELCLQEVTEMIRTDHENIQEDEEELARQECAAGYLDKDRKADKKGNNKTIGGEVELVAVSYPKEKLDQVIVDSIDGATCTACSKIIMSVTTSSFGTILKHEILTKIQYVELAEVNDEWIKTEFTEKYRVFLRFNCYHMYGKYDERQDYDLPKCIVVGRKVEIEMTRSIIVILL